jgi:hypothetical protein
VSFIDWDIYLRIEPNIHQYLSSTLYKYGLDAFILQIYPKENENYANYTLFHQNGWYERFTTSRKNSFGKITSKGFIEINFKE